MTNIFLPNYDSWKTREPEPDYGRYSYLVEGYGPFERHFVDLGEYDDAEAAHKAADAWLARQRQEHPAEADDYATEVYKGRDTACTCGPSYASRRDCPSHGRDPDDALEELRDRRMEKGR